MKKILINGIIAVLVLSCTNSHKESAPTELCGLATPVNFTADSLTFHPGDYLVFPKELKSIEFPVGIEVVTSQEDSIYRLIKTPELPPLSVIHLETEDKAYDLLVRNFRREEVYIHLPDSNYKEVRVRGNLNFWNARLSSMHKTDTGWTEVFHLMPGEYQYLVVIDGKEQRDPANPEYIDNNMGGFNSLLRVGNYRQQNLPFIESVRVNSGSMHFKSNRALTQVFVFWENQLISMQEGVEEFAVNIPAQAKRRSRSHVRLIGYNEKGISNDLLIPLQDGQVVMDAGQLNRHDWQTMILYFMMVDRFKDGDTTNDKKVDDPEILPKANYYGGDIAGIIEVMKSGYFDRLGVNTIWLSPILKNPEGAYGLFPDPHTKFSGYHGYWPVSSTKIDYRYGNKDELNQLINGLHARKMNILLDYVANHVHELHPVYQQHPDWATSLYLPDGRLNTQRWEEYRLTTWFDTFLPTLDLRRPEVVGPMTDSALYWITAFGIDGFRHDATKHIDELYWRTLTRKIKLATSCDPMIYQIGETYGSPALIASYISSGMLDAQFDFNVYDNAVAVFARDEEPFSRLQSTLNESLRFYGYHNLMGNITGNQDRPRFISLAGGDLSFDEDSKYAGWTRNIGVGDPVGYDKLKMLHAFNMTIPGLPTIYYGDEFGLPGANDPDNRRWMKFENLTEDELDVRTMVSRLAEFRRNSMPLLYGDLQFIREDETSWIFLRRYFNQLVFVVFNKGDSSRQIQFDHKGLGKMKITSFQGNNLNLENDTIRLELPAYSFDILTTKTD